MKGLISGIKRMEIHDGEGLRTTVFFKGCPLRCIWCHNPESISFEKSVAYFGEKCIGCGMCKGERCAETAAICPAEAQVFYGTEYTPEKLRDEVLKDKTFFENGGGVTLSGGECLAQADFATETARLISEQGVSVYIDTCGYVKRETFERVMPYADKFLYDIKAIDPEVHKRCTGHDNALILENLKFLSESGCRIEIRYPLVAGFNDGECVKIGEFLSNMRGIEGVKPLKYHRFAGSRYEALGMKNTLPDVETTDFDMERAAEILHGFGLKVVF